MENKRWAYIISLVDDSHVFTAFFNVLSTINKNALIIFLHPAEPALKMKCMAMGFECYSVRYRGKKDIPAALLSVIKIMSSRRIKLVHAHLFDASLIGLTAAWLLRIPKRIYTRHHSSQHILQHTHAVKYDRLINRLSTHIIAVSQNVKSILTEHEKVNARKISVVYHGFDFTSFNNISNERINALADKYNIHNKAQAIGIISRYVDWKGLQYSIPAFALVLQKHPDAVLLLANAKGPYQDEVKHHLSKLPSDSYREIQFEQDIAALYKLMTVFVHIPVDEHSEAFGQVYIEPLAAGIPCVFTLSGIAAEFITNGKEATVVPFRNTEKTAEAISALLNNRDYASQLAADGKATAIRLFSAEASVNSTLKSYEY